MTFASSARGFFETLMPGVFLLLNIVGVLVLALAELAPGSGDRILLVFLANPATVTAGSLSLGYTMGVVLRLLRPQHVDRWSGAYIKWRCRHHDDLSWVGDRFFYGPWMQKKYTQTLPVKAVDFFEEFWADKHASPHNTVFFNFCKSVIAQCDANSARDAYAAEALTRFIAGTFYALLISTPLAVGAAMLAGAHSNTAALLAASAAVLVYGGLLLVILREFRLIRHKEVDTVFAACFANRGVFEGLLPPGERSLR